jgi:hypothetical protein
MIGYLPMSALYSIVMFLVCLIGALAVSLLPETVGARLPETLDEAAVFGEKDKFFSYLPRKFFLNL